MPHIVRKTITETFLERVQTTPTAEAFQFKPTYSELGAVGVWKTVHFQGFYEDVREVSFGLLGVGVQAQDRIALISNTRYEWAVADMAILGSLGVTVPVYASNTAVDCVYILNHAEAKVVFVEDQKQLAKILDHRSELKFLEKIVVFEPSAMRIAGGASDVLTLQALREIGKREAGRDPQRFDQNLKATQPTDLLTICYTSGTTGVPKGAMITHDNLMSVIEDSVKVMSRHIESEGEVVLSFLPVSHVMGKIEAMIHYSVGWKTCFAESLDRLMVNMSEVQPTLFFAVPRTFEKARDRILVDVTEGLSIKKKAFDAAFEVGSEYFERISRHRSPTLLDRAEYLVVKKAVFEPILKKFGGRLKFAICGGAPLPVEVAEFFQILGLPILEGYGLTETCAPVTLNTMENTKLGTVGRPLPEVSIKFADDGEILIHSRKVFCGYYKDSEETERALQGGWLHTGDVGQMDEQGFLQITDRKKDLIITSGGKNIAPQKIEKLAQTHKIFSHFVVHGDRKSYLTALVTLDREQILKFATENQILFSGFPELAKHAKVVALVQRCIDEINSHLAHYETIRKFVILPRDFSVESGELTATLKVKRPVIQRKYQTELESLYGSA